MGWENLDMYFLLIFVFFNKDSRFRSILLTILTLNPDYYRIYNNCSHDYFASLVWNDIHSWLSYLALPDLLKFTLKHDCVSATWVLKSLASCFARDRGTLLDEVPLWTPSYQPIGLTESLSPCDMLTKL